MDPIQNLAERIAAGTIIEGADHAVLLLRDGEAECDWSGTARSGAAGTAQPGPDEAFPARGFLPTVLAAALLRATDLSLTGLDKPLANHLHPAVVDALRAAHATGQLATLAGVDLTVRHLLDPSWSVTLGNSDDNARDVSLDLAGTVVEETTGMSLTEAVTWLVFEPAGMESTRLTDDGEIFSTAGDLVSLIVGLESGVLVTRDSWEAMTSWAPDHSGRYEDVGIGLGRYRIGAHEVIGSYGDSGEFAFLLPFGVVLAGTVGGTACDPVPILAETLGVLC